MLLTAYEESLENLSNSFVPVCWMFCSIFLWFFHSGEETVWSSLELLVPTLFGLNINTWSQCSKLVEFIGL